MTTQLNPTQSLVLRAVANGHNKCLAISNHARMPERVTSANLGRLTKLGLLKRERCLVNRSHFVYTLTPEGKEATL